MNCHPLGTCILPKMAHTHQAFETIGRVLAAVINGSHIRGETSVRACERPSSFPPRMAFSSSRAIGVVVLHGTSFCRQKKCQSCRWFKSCWFHVLFLRDVIIAKKSKSKGPDCRIQGWIFFPLWIVSKYTHTHTHTRLVGVGEWWIFEGVNASFHYLHVKKAVPFLRSCSTYLLSSRCVPVLFRHWSRWTRRK